MYHIRQEEDSIGVTLVAESILLGSGVSTVGPSGACAPPIQFQISLPSFLVAVL